MFNRKYIFKGSIFHCYLVYWSVLGVKKNIEEDDLDVTKILKMRKQNKESIPTHPDKRNVTQKKKRDSTPRNFPQNSGACSIDIIRKKINRP